MTQPASSPQFGGLLGKGLWRIDWFGEVFYPNRGRRGTQPSIMVHFSRPKCLPETPDGWLSPSLTEFTQYHRAISVGALPYFTAGAIWLDGRLNSLPDYQLERFSDIRIDEETSVLVKAGLNLNDEGFLLPLREHPWHRECTQSYCLCVNLPDGRRLVVPCAELIRFYFGSSSSLISQLFIPSSRRSDFCKDDFSFANGHRHLTLAQGMPGRSAEDIARLVHPQAWRSSLLLTRSLLQGATSSDKIYPQFAFPFSGVTTLAASGKWVSFGGRDRNTFIVYNLRSCSAAFPFHSLTYRIEKGKDGRNSERFTMEAAQAQMQLRQRASESEKTEMVDADSGAQLEKRKRNFQTQRRFPDLENKRILQSKAVKQEQPTGIASRQPATSEEEAVGSPAGTQSIRSIDLLQALGVDGGKRNEVPKFLRPVVKELASMVNFDSRIVTASDDDGWTVAAPMIVDEDGVIDAALYVTQEDGTQRLARIALFEVEYKAHIEHLFVIETVDANVVTTKLIIAEMGTKSPWETITLATQASLTLRPATSLGELITKLLRASILEPRAFIPTVKPRSRQPLNFPD